MGEGTEIAKALVSPVNKLIDCVKCAFGKIYEPIHIRRIAKANAFALKTMQEVIDDNPTLAQAYNNGMIKIENDKINGLAIRSLERSLYQEMVKQQNLESVISKTYGLLDGEPDVIDEPVEQDWMMRFANSVETISDDDMQLLWAKVLAGEIKKPKSYSLRTLESLKNLSKEEALLFQKHCEYVISETKCSYFLNEEDLLKKSNIDMDIILRLSECGIANDSGFINRDFRFQSNESKIIYNDNIIIIMQNKTSQTLTFTCQVYPLTNFGCDLISIINQQTSDA